MHPLNKMVMHKASMCVGRCVDFDDNILMVEIYAGAQTPGELAWNRSDCFIFNTRRWLAALNAVEGIPTATLETGVIRKMFEVLDFYANGNSMDRMQDGGRRSRDVLAKLKED
jgi:hypothetical protein